MTPVEAYVSIGATSYIAQVRDLSPGHRLHYHNDHLGTPRFITRADRVFLSYHAYYPYGEEATAFNQDTEHLKLTGHERDLNSLASPADDLDYMHARYHNPQLGRFLSVDPASESGKPSQPQSWNRYAYAQGNPLKYIDPDGEALYAPLSIPDFEKNAARREVIRQVLAATVGSGAALGADAALSMVLPASPEEFQSNLNASATGLVAPISLGGRVGLLGTRGANAAYEVALAGGRHAGTLRNYAGRPVAEIQKAIGSYQRQVALHQQKIANPAKFAERWAQMTTGEQAALIAKWQKDLARNQELADVLQGLVRDVR